MDMVLSSELDERPISATITAKRNLQGFWYLEENATGRVSQDLFLSYRVAAGALNENAAYDQWEPDDDEENND